MNTEAPATIIGVFRDQSLAEQAYTELQRSGWQQGEIKLVRQHSEGMLSAFKKNFADKNIQADEDASILEHLNLPEDQLQSYQREFGAGSTLIMVQAHNRPLECRDILHRYGAYNVFIPTEPGKEHVVQLREERVNIQKNWVEVGEIRVHKRVITEDKTFTIPVTREEVTIERLPGGNTAASPHAANDNLDNDPALNEQVALANGDTTETLRDGGTIRILVHEEQVIFDKRPVVVEEIIIHKKVQQENTQFVETVKHEEASISQHGNVPVHEQPAGNVLRVKD
ncbi:hypothetical protein KDA_58420 [Dictyobacter alpinus]|uniref:DUF2382 domain-containing protein n=1 Tax=Dictyobacter alpinus TaxID=2014873 RepID=A0A402BG26_9CHLR|nr:YsnF/AvaK domain-containing protein [Dictyobacter alpinus]GCE30326.1 hypothetical protein KDA_58100 [Dictyobacter alpinus]GCE30358.1 hypothetical protein KDA_58420 [Dictyobacter alpinus]